MGVGIWFLVSNPAILGEKTNSCNPEAVSKPVEGTQEFECVSRQHINTGTGGTGYNSNPPSSGPHWQNPANNGVYDSSLPDEQLIHNLEHGYIWIAYRPDVSDEVKNRLSEIVKDDSWKVVLEPREKNDSKIALVVWGRVLKMEEPDYDKIKDFVRTYRNRGPEKTSD